jgi:hypothetical protein
MSKSLRPEGLSYMAAGDLGGSKNCVVPKGLRPEGLSYKGGLWICVGRRIVWCRKASGLKA